MPRAQAERLGLLLRPALGRVEGGSSTDAELLRRAIVRDHERDQPVREMAHQASELAHRAPEVERDEARESVSAR